MNMLLASPGLGGQTGGGIGGQQQLGVGGSLGGGVGVHPAQFLAQQVTFPDHLGAPVSVRIALSHVSCVASLLSDSYYGGNLGHIALAFAET